MTLPCILIPALVGVISAILGYLLGRLFSKNNTNDIDSSIKLQAELEKCNINSRTLQARISTLETDLLSAKASAKANVQSFVDSVSTTSAGIAASMFDAEKVNSVFGKKWKQDDLKIIEGIGPKIEELYHAAGIKTWKALAETSLEKSQEILAGGGERFKLHNPTTWAKQAEMCYLGKWEELKNWQDTLNGGKE